MTNELHHKAQDHEFLYIHSMGKRIRVTAIYTDTDDANRHMERSDNNDAVIACFGPFIFLADKYDTGIKAA